jgi:hypothetical protein
MQTASYVQQVYYSVLFVPRGSPSITSKNTSVLLLASEDLESDTQEKCLDTEFLDFNGPY